LEKADKENQCRGAQGTIKAMEEISDGFIDEIVNFKGTKRHVIANLGIRKAGTRVGIHVHENDGITFVLKGKGEITDFVEGSERSLNKQGDYYFMPRNVPMSASNLSGSDMTLLDLFVTDISTPLITIIEPGYPGYRNPVL
jgi:quercetin dioxygenase-like cupin family protein